MSVQLDIGGIAIDVVFKDIKNVHLSVYPPSGRVRIAAPVRMSIETLRLYAIARLDWIKRQQRKLQEQERETPREYIDRESHYLWGQRYLLKLQEQDQPPQVECQHNQLLLTIRPGTDQEKRAAILATWYRQQLHAAIPPLIAKWELLLGVQSSHIYIQRMKTRWGSCNPHTRSLRLNTELAKKPQACLEYVIVHELVHLLEPTHNTQFVNYMDKFLPQWHHLRDELNRAPLTHEDWEY
jgi:predicted metal-dependent hydrolase